MSTNPYAAIALKDEENPYAKVAIGAQPPAATPPQQPGFFSSLGKTFGLDPESVKASAADQQAHPIRHAFEAIPGVAPLEGAYRGFMRSTAELGKGADMAREGNPSGLLSHAISAIPIAGPAIDKASEQTPASKPGESYLRRVADVATNPGAMGTVVGAASQVAPLLMGSGATDAVESGVGKVARPVAKVASDLNQQFNPLPLRSRAVNTFQSVANDAKNVPVQLNETSPAIADFRQNVATGGRGSAVINKLGRRVDAIPAQGDINFPEARQFYTNISRASAKPGFLRRAIESPTAPDLRRNLGNVRVAMDEDLTNAAGQVGRGEDYQGALKEYANNAKLRKLGLLGAGIAGEELARRSGVLGKVATRVVGQ